MIAECIAYYSTFRNLIQVSALILDDDEVSSLHKQIRSAKITLLHQDTAVLDKELTKDDYNEVEQSFYVFFVNPPIKKYTHVLWEVELIDARQTTRKQPIWIDSELPYQEVASNPMLSGRAVLDYSRDDVNPM